MSAFADALIEGLATAEPEQRRKLAEVLVEILGPNLMTPASTEEDRWMDAREAAEYLGMRLSSLYKLTAKRAIPFEQDVDGGKLWFKRSELDAWRRGG